MKRCPRCNEPLPLISKICPVCGTAVEGENSASAEELVNQLEYILHDMKSMPIPGFISGMSRLSVFIVPIITVFLLIIAWISCAGLFWILFVLSLIWSIWVIVKKIKGTFKADIAERDFLKLKNEYELLARIAKRDFGDNREVKKLLTDISTQIYDVENRWKNGIRKNIFIWISILVVIIALSITGTCSVSSIVEKTDNEAQTMWKERVEQYQTSSLEEQNNPEIMLSITKDIINANEYDEAEKFFLNCVMGKIGDTDCARLIVTTYITNGNKDKAKTFIENCTGLRYKSDFSKIEKLLE